MKDLHKSSAAPLKREASRDHDNDEETGGIFIEKGFEITPQS